MNSLVIGRVRVAGEQQFLVRKLARASPNEAPLEGGSK